MAEDAQFGFDIEFDDKTQAFLDWVEPQLMESQVRKFLNETVPGIADYSDVWWKPPLLTRILEDALKLFVDWAGFIAQKNRVHADRLMRFVGECCIRQHPGMTWTNSPGYGAPLYSDFGPAVHFADNGNGTTVRLIAEALFVEGVGAKVAEYKIRKAGTPA